MKCDLGDIKEPLKFSFLAENVSILSSVLCKFSKIKWLFIFISHLARKLMLK